MAACSDVTAVSVALNVAERSLSGVQHLSCAPATGGHRVALTPGPHVVDS